MARVLLAMSGGVDSSVAAHLLQTTGHEVVGVFMRHGAVAAQDQCATPTDSIAGAHKQGCCSAADAADARRVADQLDIPFYALDLQADFGRIIDYFVDEYSAGARQTRASSVTNGSSSVGCSPMPTRSGPSLWPPATTRAAFNVNRASSG